MTTTSIPDTTATPGTGCGPDCIIIDGACRCYHGEPAQPAPAWMDNLTVPF
ncbi:MAG TPA: hypothetical protein VNF47_23510 [Streptosporangiaceae bacterium]|nr:hypothetical protein [Streptosporangiaceae bacterium]